MKNRIGVLVALQEEFEVLVDVFNIKYEKNILDNYLVVETKYSTSKGDELDMIILLINDMSNTASAAATQYFVDRHNCQIYINIGIAGLLSKDNYLLDVILGTTSWEYDYRTSIVDNKNIDHFESNFGGKELITTDFLSNNLSQLSISYKHKFNEWNEQSSNALISKLNDNDIKWLKEQKLLPESENQVVNKGVLFSGGTIKSEKFKQHLLSKNRLGKAIDMESAGFLHSIHKLRATPLTLVIKAISDPADNRKSAIDKLGNGAIRKIAMENASNLLKLFLEIFNFNNNEFINDEQVINVETDTLHIKTLKVLNTAFNIDLTSEYLTLWSKVFHNLVVQHQTNFKEDSFIHDMFSYINASDNKIPLYISGEPGSGLSICLSALYRVFYHNYQNNETQYYPIYIDFRLFSQKTRKDKTDMIQQAQSLAIEEMNAIKVFLNSKQIKNILLIYDRIDNTSEIHNSLINVLSEQFNSYSKKK